MLFLIGVAEVAEQSVLMWTRVTYLESTYAAERVSGMSKDFVEMVSWCCSIDKVEQHCKKCAMTYLATTCCWMVIV